MFNGIIQNIGKISSIDVGEFCFFSSNKDFLTEVNIGNSIAVNGVCLTVSEIVDNNFKAYLSKETLSCSTFGTLQVGDAVNMEKALRLNQGIDGHLVSGHIDGVGKVVYRSVEGESMRFKISVADNLLKYIARKCSICINGVSLTVNAIDGSVFAVNIVPHTLIATTLGELQVGSELNLEVDMIARHLQQLLA